MKDKVLSVSKKTFTIKMMRQFVMPVLAIVALLLSNVLMAPDVHADQGQNFAHAGDHIFAHGAEHFDSGQHEEDSPGQGHSEFHHHNCSFNLAGATPSPLATFWHPAVLRGPLRTSPLVSRAPSVPKQPPKA